jgi:putative SOS response-associated peptidase YedK
MCNLYSLTKGQAAIRDCFRATNDRTGNLPLFPAIFPDQMAPIVRNGADGERELVMARWGMPGPPQFGGAPITNIRNLGSPHWRGWLGKQNPALCQRPRFASSPIPSRARPKWFALSQDRPLFGFAGLWTAWRGIREPKSAPVDGQHELFGFLTTEANAVVAPIHPKAMWTCLGKVESSSEGKRSISWASRSDGSGRNLKPKPFGWLR